MAKWREDCADAEIVKVATERLAREGVRSERKAYLFDVFRVWACLR
jgi:hypothetical protein